MAKFYSGIPAALIGAGAIASIQITAQISTAFALEATQISEVAATFTVMIDGDCQGSGAIIDRVGENYTVLTANHVVATTGECFIQTSDGMRYKIYESRPIARTDLAVLQFQSRKNYSVAQQGNSTNLRPGATVYFAGFPSPGQVDTKRSYRFYEVRVTSRPQGSKEGYDLSYGGDALPGMSGGPILDSTGRLVGIHGKADVREIQGAVGNYGVPLEIFLARRGEVAPQAQPAPAQRPRVQIEPPPPVTLQPAPAPVARVEPPAPVARVEPPAPVPEPQPSLNPPEPEPEPIAAREAASPAESAINSMVRGQQTHVSRNRNFLNSVPSIAKTFTILLPQDYNFAIRTTTRGAFHYAIPKSPEMKAYVGAIFLQENASLNNPVTVSIVCEATAAIGVRPADPSYGRGNLVCGVGTQQRTVSSFGQQNAPVAPVAPVATAAPAAPVRTPAAAPAAPQTRAAQPAQGFLSLVNVCNTYDLSGQSPHQEQALQWLQGKISPQTMQKFADEWRSQLIAKASNSPINLIDVCKVYDRAGLHPHQNRALEWLQQQIPKQTLTDFGKKWQNPTAGG
ncbi:trypsin-like peptidase domain-containing protein [Microcoleus sp. herbarium19]|uniref:trypsin-like peptidase domain-containing protein n=1 Tax=unclassified Microcoleus TaxID=2642155 RepID=UPI002FD3DD4E